MAETRTISARKGTESEPTPASKPPRQRITKRKANENHARSYFDALARRDAAGMADHWKEDGVVDLAPLGIFRGRDRISAFFREMFAAFPDLETEITRLTAGQSDVAVEWRMTGTFTGAPFQGLEPNGRTVQLRGVDLIEIADGKNVTNTAYYDGMAFARGLGMLPPQDSSAERAMKGALNAATKLRRAVSEGKDAVAQRRDALGPRGAA